MSTVDVNRVIFTGENSAIRLSNNDSDSFTTNATFWRAVSSGAGSGHVLYLKSELTEARWRIRRIGDRLKWWSWCVPAPLLHAKTCGRVRRWSTCVLHTVSDSGSGHAHTEGFCALLLVGTRCSFRTSGVDHLEEVRATNWGSGVYADAKANGARTTKEPSPHERNEPPGRTLCWAQVAANASSITRQTDLWRSSVG